jgi:hypothetical protein
VFPTIASGCGVGVGVGVCGRVSIGGHHKGSLLYICWTVILAVLGDSGDIVRVLEIKGLAVNLMPDLWLMRL